MNQEEQLKIKQRMKEDEELFNYAGEDRMIASDELKIEIDNKAEDSFALTTQFSALDSAFKGFKPGNLIVVAGHTEHGKTELCADFATHFTQNRNKIVWFNFETSQRQLLDRFTRKAEGIDFPVFYLPRRKENSFNWFLKRIREAILKFQPKVIFIDNLAGLIEMPDF